MYEVVLSSKDGDVQVMSDGKTVWVNNYRGYLIGRFSRVGVDVHAPPGTGLHCLDCFAADKPFGKPSRKLWDRFCASMLEHHGVELPSGDELIDQWEDE